VARDRTETSLAAIVETVLAGGAVPALVAFDGPVGPLGGGYGEFYERLGDRHGVPVVADALAEVLFDPALKSDAIHPNARGHDRLAEAVAEAVEPLVAERRRRGLPVGGEAR
jgi:lysophospholipase L1-like esterase